MSTNSVLILRTQGEKKVKSSCLHGAQLIGETVSNSHTYKNEVKTVTSKGHITVHKKGHVVIREENRDFLRKQNFNSGLKDQEKITSGGAFYAKRTAFCAKVLW